ncbi:MAG: cardiolipin synthase [Xanthomonadaceae bacterium]|jgi:cardiolipin synthase|nr:cardiolipin synthase [Xanthomonadaceae bacterium]
MSEALRLFWEWLSHTPHLKAYLATIYGIYLLGLSIWIILQKREPISTLSWLLALAALPYLGFLIYYLFGPQRIKRQKLRRGRSRSKANIARYSAAASPTLHRTNFLSRLAQSTTGLAPSTATDVRWLIDGTDTYDAILAEIATATDHVHLEYYIFDPDHTGTRFRDALAERARAGVKIRLLLDAVGSARIDRRFLRPLTDAGAEVVWFHPIQLFRPFKRPWLNLRTHRKIVVVDGRVAFIGGINITDEENEQLRDDAYRDLHMRLQGGIVRSIQLVFVEDWIYATGQGRDRFDISRLWPAETSDTRNGHITAQTLISGPDTEWETIHRLHIAAIEKAQKRAWLVTPYFVPSEAARMALTSAALAGLDTRLLVPKRSDSPFVTLAARSYFDELLKSGVKVYEYGPRMLHTKALVVDDDLCIVGSANFDQRSFKLNFEISILLQDHATARVLIALLETEFANARRLPRNRSTSFWRERLPEACARLLSPLL